MTHQQHWNDVYQNKGDSELSWFQSDPQTSLELIRAAAPAGRGRLIDIGGGSSMLIDHLLCLKFDKLAVLDISRAALDRARARLGDRASTVDWIETNITKTDNIGEFDIWHDRAVFHFLTDRAHREHYS